MNEAATNVHEQVSVRTQVLHTLDGHSGMGLLDRVVMTLSSEWKSLSRVQLFVTPWTVQSMEISRPEYWRGEPFPSPGDLTNPGVEPRSPALQVNSLPAEPQGKPGNTGVGSLSLLQRIFLTQELNRGLLHCRQILYQLSHKGRPNG